MRFFDLHCDTLKRILIENKNLFSNDCHISIERAKKYSNYVQCFAIFISDELDEIESFEFFKNAKKKLDEQILLYKNDIELCKSFNSVGNNKKISAIFTVENGSLIGKDVNKIKYLHDHGVRAMTLTWNGSNEIGDGSGVKNAKGLTKFGKNALKEMEKFGIIVDISHASEKLFYDVAECSTKPFIASHSNSKTVCNHVRNLSDEQFKIIKNAGGIIGINLCKYFLSEKETVDFDDILKHIDHFLSLNGEDIVCFGCDFDGADDMPKGISGIESVENFFEYCLKHNYNETLLDKIFFGNAYSFFEKALQN